MEGKKDLRQVYDLFLSVPGMNEQVKVDVKISRKNILLLSQILDKSLQKDQDGLFAILGAAPGESVEELRIIAGEYLEKAGLVELNDKLKKL